MKREYAGLYARLAEGESDLHAVSRLRYRVFCEELGAKGQDGVERDHYDRFARHMILIDSDKERDDPENKVVGVYRLIDREAAASAGGFYSASEFNIAPLLDAPGNILELSRSCVDRAYRGGFAMAKLWSEISRYISENKYKYIFGVGSFHGIEADRFLPSLSYLYHYCRTPENLRISVNPENALDIDFIAKDAINRVEAVKHIPTLIKSYLRLGGWVGDGVYVDREFNTLDVFVLMQTDKMIDRFKRVYD